MYANRKYFISKWGFNTFAFDEIKYALMRVLNEEDHAKKLNILEIGCGIGVTLLKVKYQYKNASLFGIEPDKNMAKIAQNVACVCTKPAGEFPLDFEKGSFDYILAGNDIETLDDPEKFLCEIKSYIKPGGFIIATVQNIMHYSVIFELLSGKWLYAVQAKLNKTNKTFFTLDDINKLFLKCGYVNPYVFHWFSVPDESERSFIGKLCDAGAEKREFLFTTYLFSVKYQK